MDNISDEHKIYAGFAIAVVILVLTIVYLFGGEKKAKGALDPEVWKEYPLTQIDQISHDVKKFRFSLDSQSQVLGLPIGQHISLKFIGEDGKECQRSYTPVSSDENLGFVDFVVKVYFPSPPKFPDGGKMSQHLNNLKIGDTIMMKGPKGHLDYKGRGVFSIARRRDNIVEYRKKKIGMIAGGTGITPMLQVIRAVLRNPSDKTEIWLIFANQTEADILLRKELEEIPTDRFHLWYTLDRPPEGWSYSSGFINADMCRSHLPAPSNDTFLFVCGPPPMIKFACEPAFKELGFAETDYFSF